MDQFNNIPDALGGLREPADFLVRDIGFGHCVAGDPGGLMELPVDLGDGVLQLGCSARGRSHIGRRLLRRQYQAGGLLRGGIGRSRKLRGNGPQLNSAVFDATANMVSTFSRNDFIAASTSARRFSNSRREAFSVTSSWMATHPPAFDGIA